MWITRRFPRIVLLAVAVSLGFAQDGLKMGDPGCDVTLGDREPANRKFFQLCHSYDLKVPLWVGYVLTKADLDGPAARPSGFLEDKQLKHPGAKDSDYVRSGYSRGHMAPAEDFSRSKEVVPGPRRSAYAVTLFVRNARHLTTAKHIGFPVLAS